MSRVAALENESSAKHLLQDKQTFQRVEVTESGSSKVLNFHGHTKSSTPRIGLGANRL